MCSTSRPASDARRHAASYIDFYVALIEGLTQTQFAALAKLYELGPVRRTTSAGSSTGRRDHQRVVDRLHVRGFVTALNDPKDRAAAPSRLPSVDGT
jgi:hypothetical protein